MLTMYSKQFLLHLTSKKGYIMPEMKTAVIILTKNFRIEGKVDLIPGARLTDFVNESKRFMVVTDAKVSNHRGKKLMKGKFIDVHVRKIEVILPADKEA